MGRDRGAVEPESYYNEPEDYLEETDRTKNKEKFSEFLKIREAFAEHLDADDVLLDAGCGPGVDADYFVEKVGRYIGVDISKDNIRYAKRNKTGNFKVMDLRNLRFEDGYFDGIWNSATLYYMPPEDMEEALKELDRVLKDDGVAFLSWKEGEGSALKGEGDKIREYYVSQEEAEELVEEHFEIVERFRDESKEKYFISFLVKK